MTTMLPTHRPPTHPGEMLLKELLEPYELTQTEAAQLLGISFVRLNELIKGKRGITPDTALRLQAVFRVSAGFWLSLQQDWDLWHAQHSPEGAAINRIKPLKKKRMATA